MLISPSVSGRPVPRPFVVAAVALMAAIAAACGSESSTTSAPSTTASSTTSTEGPSLPQAAGLVLVVPPVITGDLTIPATGLPRSVLRIEDGCITALLENGESVTLHFFDGYAGFDGTTLFFRPFGQPDSVPAEFQDGDPIGITGHDAVPPMEHVVAPPADCPSEGTVVYKIRRR